MDCHFTEEVSLLVDGELAPHEAARLCTHVEGCAACQRARESFLLLRQELRSYEWAPGPNAQSAALASILNSHKSDQGAAHSKSPRGIVGRLAGSLAGAFDVRRLRPAHVATLALLLIATALGVRWLRGSHTPSGTPQSAPPAVANANSLPAPAPVVIPTIEDAKTPKAPPPAGGATSPREGRESARAQRGGSRTARPNRGGSSPDLRQESARVVEPAALPSLPSSASVVSQYAALSLRAAADPSLSIGRHAERVERLLRSFRNARMTENESTLDVADARRLSKRLLYNNIALRREAESAGDLPVEGLLDSVEPILIDISNLPNTPSPDAVGSIKERINRRQLVGALQARGMLASR
jgi:negative regulator of sigma E activity